ncbi:unnamed protein product [Closterium sp. NIES-65]|nr:unnamed protein product [Closterium sp. NIES-65]
MISIPSPRLPSRLNGRPQSAIPAMPPATTPAAHSSAFCSTVTACASRSSRRAKRGEFVRRLAVIGVGAFLLVWLATWFGDDWDAGFAEPGHVAPQNDDSDGDGDGDVAVPGSIPQSPPRFILYRMIGNDIPPLQCDGQLYENTLYALQHEPRRLAGCRRVWVVNNVVNETSEQLVVRALKAHGYGDEDIIVRRINYSHVAQLPEDQWGAAVSAQNEARNAMLEHGQASGARWILPWDGNQFLTREAWHRIVAAADRYEAQGLTVFKVCVGGSRGVCEEEVEVSLQPAGVGWTSQNTPFLSVHSVSLVPLTVNLVVWHHTSPHVSPQLSTSRHIPLQNPAFIQAFHISPYLPTSFHTPPLLCCSLPAAPTNQPINQPADQVAMVKVQSVQQPAWLNASSLFRHIRPHAPGQWESQVAFRNDSPHRFKEGVAYGDANKLDTLIRVCGSGCFWIWPELLKALHLVQRPPTWAPCREFFADTGECGCQAVIGRDYHERRVSVRTALQCGYSVRLWYHPCPGVDIKKAFRSTAYRTELRARGREMFQEQIRADMARHGVLPVMGKADGGEL